MFLHSLEVWRELTPLQLRTPNQADVLIANSHFTVVRAPEINSGITRRIDVCHLGLRPEEDPDFPLKAPSEPLDEAVLKRLGRDYVLIVGRMVEAEGHKGHDPAGLWQIPGNHASY